MHVGWRAVNAAWLKNSRGCEDDTRCIAMKHNSVKTRHARISAKRKVNGFLQSRVFFPRTTGLFVLSPFALHSRSHVYCNRQSPLPPLQSLEAKMEEETELASGFFFILSHVYTSFWTGWPDIVAQEASPFLEIFSRVSEMPNHIFTACNLTERDISLSIAFICTVFKCRLVCQIRPRDN